MKVIKALFAELLSTNRPINKEPQKCEEAVVKT